MLIVLLTAVLGVLAGLPSGLGFGAGISIFGAETIGAGTSIFGALMDGSAMSPGSPESSA